MTRDRRPSKEVELTLAEREEMVRYFLDALTSAFSVVPVREHAVPLARVRAGLPGLSTQPAGRDSDISTDAIGAYRP